MSREYQIASVPEGLAIELYAMPELGEEDKNDVLAFLTYDGTFDAKRITKAVGRNVLWELRQPVGVFDTVQVSGVGFFDVGITGNTGPSAVFFDRERGSAPILPPRADAPPFTHRTSVIENGQVVDVTQRSPMGSYTQEAAEWKYRQMQQVMRMINDGNWPFLVPLPMSVVHFRDIPDGVGGCQSAIVSLCPAGGMRREDLPVWVVEDGADRDGIVKTFFPVMRGLGQAARALHDSGWCHYQMTLGNVSPEMVDRNTTQSLVCVYDWETLRPMDAKTPDLARAFDMAVSVASWAVVLQTLLGREMISPEDVLILGYSGFLAYLEGYSGEGAQTIDQKIGFSDDDIVTLGYGSPLEIVRIVTRVLTTGGGWIY